MDKLKPCPFCGGEAIMRVTKHIPNGFEYTPQCSDASCAGRLTKKWLSKDVAVYAWNRRTAVDAEPVRHGYWIDDRMDVVCSACGTRFNDSIDFIQGADGGRPKRCPECGAKMDEQKAGE